MNRRRMTTTMLVLAMAMAAAACDKGTGLEPGQSVQRSSSALQIDVPPLVYFQPLPRFTLAVDLIGRGLNGTALNGKVLDGRFVVEVSLKDKKATVVANGVSSQTIEDAVAKAGYKARLMAAVPPPR